MTQWFTIEEFPRYEMSDQGDVRNIFTGRIIVPSQNGTGVAFVGLMHEGVQYKRSVAKLMSECFVDPINENHDTPIHLDGDKNNNHPSNLMLRPRWFAIKYARQFHERVMPTIKRPIRCIESGEEYNDSLVAAQVCGLLEIEVSLSITNGTMCWPTYQRFEMAEAIRD